jgi:transposase-like protein
VEIDVPRDRDSSFEPRIVAKRQKRLTGVDEMVISLSARGLTPGEISAHLAEVYGADVSRQTVSTITDKVVEGMVEWQNRPLDPVYPVIFIDAVHVKIRCGQVANRPICMALAVTCEGHRDILGLWDNAWAEFVPFLAFDTEIRRVICSTNAIESVNARIRRAVKARGHFPNDQAALTCVYLAIMSLDPTAPAANAGPCAGRPPSTPSTAAWPPDASNPPQPELLNRK